MREKFIILYLTIFHSTNEIHELDIVAVLVLSAASSPSMEFLYYVKNWHFHIFLLSSWTSCKLTSALHS